MKYLLWILMLFAAAVAVTIASHTPAYVLLLYPPYRIELSLTLFVGLLLLLFALGYGLVRFITATVQLPSYVRDFREQRLQNKRKAMLDEALEAFFEGRYALAEKAAARAISLGETSPLYAVIAARSAHAMQDYVKRDTYLATAAPDSVMRLMATAEFMLEQRQPQSALAALQSLSESGVKNHLGALKLSLKAHQQAGHWDEALMVLEQLEKRAAVDITTATLLRQHAYLDGVAQQRELPALREYWKSIPVEFRRRNKLAAAVARAMLRLGGGAHIAPLLIESLESQWDSDLAGLFGLCQSDNVLAQIDQAEQWLKSHKDDAVLLLTLGKLCTYQQLWGKAKTYLDASIGIAPSAVAYTALAQLAEKLEQPAFPYYQQAAALSVCES